MDDQTDDGLLRLMWLSAIKETDLVEDALKASDSVEWRRIFVRTVFATLESICSAAMDVIYWRCFAQVIKNRKPGVWDIKDEKEHFRLTMLRNRSYEVKENGEIQEVKGKLNTQRRLLFALKSLAFSHGTTIAPTTKDGWSSLKAAIKVRDRITHPKSHEDLNVTAAEVNQARKALSWFTGCLKEARPKVSVKR
jgi:hypothetical protein